MKEEKRNGLGSGDGCGERGMHARFGNHDLLRREARQPAAIGRRRVVQSSQPGFRVLLQVQFTEDKA